MIKLAINNIPHNINIMNERLSDNLNELSLTKKHFDNMKIKTSMIVSLVKQS